jgi:hypothetical protein
LKEAFLKNHSLPGNLSKCEEHLFWNVFYVILFLKKKLLVREEESMKWTLFGLFFRRLALSWHGLSVTPGSTLLYFHPTWKKRTPSFRIFAFSCINKYINFYPLPC